MNRCTANEKEVTIGINFPSFRKKSFEMASFAGLSARLGRDPLLVQASSGNTSLKTDGVLWIKASGKWLQNAEREEIFVAVDIAQANECFRRNTDLPQTCSATSASSLCPSIETFMHSVLPHRIVIHVHSVNTIAWAVRRDAEARLAERLSGLQWRLIPYAASGSPLAQEIEYAISRAPGADVFVLANHGLAVCGPDCETAEALLTEVESRLKVDPRSAARPEKEVLARFEEATYWKMSAVDELHALGTDSVSWRILAEGVLYPCQALFLGRHAPLVPRSVAPCEMECWFERSYGIQPFAVIEGSGTLLGSNVSKAELAVLQGLVEVVQRVEADAPIRYLPESDISDVLTATGYRYRDLAEHH